MNKSMKKILILVLALIFLPSLFFLRLESGGINFASPLGIPLQLSGTSGEVRGFSLHTGIDIKTRGRNGFPVKATAQGSVARIISGKNGYGNAIFLEQGGIESVYGHLYSFEDEKRGIYSIVEMLKILYNQDFIDFRFANSPLNFKQGDVIAYSGESGAGISHLHYEVRTATGFLNPLKYLKIRDTEPPVFDWLFVCSEKHGTTIDEKKIKIEKRWGKYYPAQSEIECATPGKLFFKVSCFDMVNARNSVAVSRLELLEDSGRVFDINFNEIDKTDLEYGQYIYDISKSTIDGFAAYSYFLCRHNGNKFSGIKSANDGYFSPENKKRSISIIISDYAGNSSRVDFTLLCKKAAGEPDGILVNGSKNFTLSDTSGRLSVSISPGSVKGEMLMKAMELGTEKLKEITHASISNGCDIISLYAVYPFDTVYARPVSISIKYPRKDKSDDHKKTSIYQFFEGKKPKLIKSAYNSRSKRFESASRINGYFALLRDDAPPEIIIPPTHEFIEDAGIFRRLRLYIIDRLSEVNTDSIECFIDGQAMPCEYDRDRKWVETTIPNPAAGTIHHIMVKCSDNAGNVAVFRNLVQ